MADKIELEASGLNKNSDIQLEIFKLLKQIEINTRK